jgi:hypothetical protein
LAEIILDYAHNARIMCFMKNLTLRIDEDILAKARQIASEHTTSVNALIREYLSDLVRQKSRQEIARKELSELCRESTAMIGNRTWTRDELHDR